jgi:hypothetical protein
LLYEQSKSYYEQWVGEDCVRPQVKVQNLFHLAH